MLSKLALSFSVISLSACASVGQPASTALAVAQPALPAPIGIAHTVQKGETLWRISKMYRADIENIVAANRISGSAPILVGQTLIIPDSKDRRKDPGANFNNSPVTDFIWPVKGKVITQFHQRIDGVLSKGIDIATEQRSDILACQDGRVAFVGDLPGYGSTLIINHQDNLSSIYCGNGSVAVKTGDDVKQGMIVAKIGHNPRQAQSALHFEIRKRHRPQNPLYFLN